MSNSLWILFVFLLHRVVFFFSFRFILMVDVLKESYCEIVMFIWWHRIWNTDSEPKHQQWFDTDASPAQQSHIEDSGGDDDDDDDQNRITKTTHPHPSSPAPHHHHHHHHQLPYSVHHNCAGQSKCVRTTRTDHSSRMNSFCLAIIFVHCFNVLAIASENSNNSQPQPCDRSRRVFTDIQGEISNGPPGYNYTQVSHLLFYEQNFQHFAIVIELNCSLAHARSN